MMVNATLLVQIINFIIAYVIVRYLLFKPAYAIITSEQKLEATLVEGISKQEQLIADLQQMQKMELVANQEYFKQNKPSLSQKQVTIQYHVAITSPTTVEVSNYATEVSQAIVTAIRQHNDNQ